MDMGCCRDFLGMGYCLLCEGRFEKRQSWHSVAYLLNQSNLYHYHN